MSKNYHWPSVPKREDDDERRIRQKKAKLKSDAREYKPENLHRKTSYKCLKKLPWDTQILDSTNAKVLQIDIDEVPKKCLKNRSG